MKFFECDGLSRLALSGIFVLKIIFGVALSLIYTYYYTDRSTADIFKFFDASEIMYNVFWEKPGDFFRLLFGVQNDNMYFEQNYNTYMMNWTPKYNSNFAHETHTMIRFNTVLRFISFGYYNVHTVFMCFISLTGLTAIYKTFAPFLANKKTELAVVIFLIPAVLFWSSGVLKEGLMFFGLGMLIHYFHRLSEKGVSLKAILWICFAAILLRYTKLYLLIAILPCLVAVFWVTRSSYKHVIIKYGIVFIGFVVLGLNVHRIYPSPKPLETLATKQKNFINVAKGGAYLQRNTGLLTDTIYIGPNDMNCIKELRQEKFGQFITYVRLKAGCEYQVIRGEHFIASGVVDEKDTLTYLMFAKLGNPGSAIKIEKLSPELSSFIKHIPGAIRNTWLRPYLWEAKSPLLLVAALENILIMLICMVCVIFMKRLRSVEINLLCFSLTFVFTISTLIGLITPILGAINRYRVPVLPFLLITFLLLLNKEKLIRKLAFFKFRKR